MKMDYRANGEVVFRALRVLGPDSMRYPNRWDIRGWYQEKEGLRGSEWVKLYLLEHAS